MFFLEEYINHNEMKYEIIIPNSGAKTINTITIKTPEGSNSPSLAAFNQLTIFNP